MELEGFSRQMVDEAIRLYLEEAYGDASPPESVQTRLRLPEGKTLAELAAAETFERALETEMTEERAKELRYFLGDVLMRMEEMPRALEQFSAVAQVDYNYRDVRERIEEIRKKTEEGGAPESETPAGPEAG